jgi:hypothetical protein
MFEISKQAFENMCFFLPFLATEDTENEDNESR